MIFPYNGVFFIHKIHDTMAHVTVWVNPENSSGKKIGINLHK
jgi:hypothetical protein